MRKQELSHKLIEIYQEELFCYKKMLDLTKEQKKLIEEDKLDELEKLLAEKDIYISKINQLELMPCKEEVMEKLKIGRKEFLKEVLKSEFSTLQLKELIGDLFDTIKSLYNYDQINQQLIQEKKRELSKSINKIRRGNKMNNLYNHKDKRIHSTFIDSKS